VRYFEHFGFHVTEASDGDELLAAVNRAQPHVILTELTLPHMAASRLSQWLANSHQTRHIPVIVTADEFGEDIETKLGRPAAVLFKPFPLAAMLDEVRRVLRHH
jgi:DNA-binding response OmpR family regulator